MRFAAFPMLVFLALSASSCSAEQTPVASTAAVPTDTQPASTLTPEPTETPSGPLGSISGTILPPGAEQPATSIRIYAREKASSKVFAIEIPLTQTTYTLSGLPMGTYTVFAWFYPNGAPGAYTSSKIVFATTSSDQFKCSNSLIEIVLTEKNPDFQGADIGCWAGDFFIYITPMP